MTRIMKVVRVYQTVACRFRSWYLPTVLSLPLLSPWLCPIPECPVPDPVQSLTPPTPGLRPGSDSAESQLLTTLLNCL